MSSKAPIDPNLCVFLWHFAGVTVTLSRQEIYITLQGCEDKRRMVVMETDPYMDVRIV